MNLQVLPRCQCCHGVPEQGLYDGIRVQGVLFCSSCCETLATSPIGSPFYEKFFHQVKKALYTVC